MGSTRLPGKVMMKINDDTILSSLFRQLDFSKRINRKIIATTNNKEDNIIEKFARENTIAVFRGSNLDVLDRYYQCAKKLSINQIVRITADNPLIDPEIVDQIVSVYEEGNYDYVNNFTKRTFPYGTEVEVFSFKTLEKTWQNTKDPYDREHVTPFIYNNPGIFSTKCIEYHENISNLRWTVDDIDDLERVRKIYSKINKRPIVLADILKSIDKNTE
jgi:spore coat polysaccharide biosynthesis protein SpsF